MNFAELRDPLVMARVLWPNVTFYDKQREILKSIERNDATFVPAGNMLGKDFVAGYVVLWFFLTRHPVRIITTSAKADHLRVLWGEIGQYIQTCKVPLTIDKGGPLWITHQEIRKIYNGEKCPKSYVKGLVASADSIAAMQGHHIANTGDGIPRTMFVSDESSSVPDEYYTMATSWSNRDFVFGNTWPCENFFKRGVKAGDLYSEDGSRCYRKVIRIRATDSPNVRLAHAQIRLGMKPTGEMLIPGVKGWDEYQKNLATWNKLEQAVKLRAEFYEGAEVKMFPEEWLNRAAQMAAKTNGRMRVAKAGGCDPAEGGDRTSMCAVDEYGVIDLVSRRTPDTNVITGEALAFMHRHSIPPDRFVFDRGGGGKQHADRLRAMGYPVRTLSFGEQVVLRIKRGLRPVSERRDHRETRYEYTNMRAMLYGELRELLDPASDGKFGMPESITHHVYEPGRATLRQQLDPIPLTYDQEGRLKLIPKGRRSIELGKDEPEQCLKDLIGCSPDEADALVLAVHGMLHEEGKRRVGAPGYGVHN